MSSVRAFAKLTGLPASEVHPSLRKHIGVVFDVCHQAVEYEDRRDALEKLLNAGIPIMKLQLAAALRAPSVSQEDVDRLSVSLGRST